LGLKTFVFGGTCVVDEQLLFAVPSAALSPGRRRWAVTFLIIIIDASFGLGYVVEIDRFFRVFVLYWDSCLILADLRGVLDRAAGEPAGQLARVALESGLIAKVLLLGEEGVARRQIGQEDGYFKVV